MEQRYRSRRDPCLPSLSSLCARPHPAPAPHRRPQAHSSRALWKRTTTTTLWAIRGAAARHGFRNGVPSPILFPGAKASHSERAAIALVIVRTHRSRLWRYRRHCAWGHCHPSSIDTISPDFPVASIGGNVANMLNTHQETRKPSRWRQPGKACSCSPRWGKASWGYC